MTMNVDRAQAVQHFMDTLARMDFDGLTELLADDVVADFPYSPTPTRSEPIKGKHAVVAHLKKAVPMLLKEIRFFYDVFYPGQDPDVVVVEFHSVGEQAGNRGPYANEYISVFRFQNGKIIFWKEFFDVWRVMQQGKKQR